VKEKALAAKIDELWHGMEFDWYRNGDLNVYTGIGLLTMAGK